jgi:hypothetical protein
MSSCPITEIRPDRTVESITILLLSHRDAQLNIWYAEREREMKVHRLTIYHSP